MIPIGFGLDGHVRSALAPGGLCLVTVTEAYDAMPLDTDGRLTLWLVVPKGNVTL